MRRGNCFCFTAVAFLFVFFRARTVLTREGVVRLRRFPPSPNFVKTALLRLMFSSRLFSYSDRCAGIWLCGICFCSLLPSLLVCHVRTVRRGESNDLRRQRRWIRRRRKKNGGGVVEERKKRRSTTTTTNNNKLFTTNNNEE